MIPDASLLWLLLLRRCTDVSLIAAAAAAQGAHWHTEI
jgi:hypothetical protein